MPVLEENVLRLDVAMNDALSVRERERIRDLAYQTQRRRGIELSLAVHAMAQRLTRGERHDVVQQAVASAGREDGQDVGMLQSRGELHLLLETGGTDFARQLRREHLDDDLPVQL